MSSTPVVVTPSSSLAQSPRLLRKLYASSVAAGSTGSASAARSSRACAAARRPATVVSPWIDGCVPYAAMKFASDSVCFRLKLRSAQLSYGVSAELPVSA